MGPRVRARKTLIPGSHQFKSAPLKKGEPGGGEKGMEGKERMKGRKQVEIVSIVSN